MHTDASRRRCSGLSYCIGVACSIALVSNVWLSTTSAVATFVAGFAAHPRTRTGGSIQLQANADKEERSVQGARKTRTLASIVGIVKKEPEPEKILTPAQIALRKEVAIKWETDEPAAPKPLTDAQIAFLQKKQDLKECLRREYTSFFRPFEPEFYDEKVRFRDPLNELEGKDKYRSNVEMLSGDSLIGNILFKDGFIDLHGVEDIPGNDYKLRTRWTLGFNFKLLPWQPQALFSGVSEYKIDSNAKVITQRDYWDTINLDSDGQYSAKGDGGGVRDMVAQFIPGLLKLLVPADFKVPDEPAPLSEGKWSLLRRADDYRIYRANGQVFALLVPDASQEDLPGTSRRLFLILKQLLTGHGLVTGAALQVDRASGSVETLANDDVAVDAIPKSGDRVVGIELLPPNPWQVPAEEEA